MAERGEFTHATMLDMDSRLRVAGAIEKDETQASISVFQMLKRRGHPDGPPPMISDGWGGIDQAMMEVYAKVPDYSGRGRPFKRKKPEKDGLYLQIVKQRDEHNIVKNVHNASDSQQFRRKDCGKRSVLQLRCGYTEEQKGQILAAYYERPERHRAHL